jgi:hypothetical protein
MSLSSPLDAALRERVNDGNVPEAGQNDFLIFLRELDEARCQRPLAASGSRNGELSVTFIKCSIQAETLRCVR